MRKLDGMLVRVLIISVLAAVAFAARPGLSFAQSALQVVVQESSSSYHFGEESELKITNTTPTTLCANIYYYYDDGTPACCSGCLVSPFASLSTDAAEDSVGFDEGSIFILSGSPTNRRGALACDDTIPIASPGLRTWLTVDDEGPVGISAQDVSASTSGTIQKLVSDCKSNGVDCGSCSD